MVGSDSKRIARVQRGSGRSVAVMPAARANALGMDEGLAAGTFYAALAALVGGAIVFARGAVERRGAGNRLAFALLAVGIVGIATSLGFYLIGPRRMLPF